MTKHVKFQCYVSPTTKARLDSRTTKNKKAGDVIADLLDIADDSTIFKYINREDLDKVCEVKNFNISQLHIEALNDYIKKVKNADKKGLSSHTKSVQADSHIAEIVNEIIESNNKANSLDDVLYINQNSIMNWLRKHNKPLINFAVVTRYLRVNAEKLAEHHKILNIKESHNRDLYMKKRLFKAM